MFVCLFVLFCLFISLTRDFSYRNKHSILDFFSIKESSLPGVRLIDLAQDMTKYKPEATEITAASLKAFASDFLAGKLKVCLVTLVSFFIFNFAHYCFFFFSLLLIYFPLFLPFFLFQPHLMSEETPADWDSKPVKVLTGGNFQTVALDPTKNVFVEFCKFFV